MGEDNCCQMASGIVTNLQRLLQFFLAHLYDSAALSNKRRPFVEHNGKNGNYKMAPVTCSPNYLLLVPG